MCAAFQRADVRVHCTALRALTTQAPGTQAPGIAATETKYEYGFTPSKFVQIEFGTLGSTHNIGGVTDFDNRNAAGFAGGLAEFRYLALERTSNNQLSVTLAFERNVRLIDETSDERVHNYEFETTVNADLELLRNRLYAGFDLLY